MFSTRTHALISILFSLTIMLSLPLSISQAATSDWNSVSDEQIARLFFPNGKLGFGDSTEGSVEEYESLDGVLVHELQRVKANFDNDAEEEMAVLIVYNAELAYAEYTKAIFAILDLESENIKIRWRAEGSVNAPVNISAMKLINKDNFSALAYTYDRSHAASGSSYQKMKIIRWDGKRFSEIWSYNLQSYDSGGRGGIPHDYSAKVDFVDTDKVAKRIRVGATFTYHHNQEHLRKQYKLNEEFVWSEKEQKYLAVTSRKASPLPLLEVHRVGDLPSAKEFPSFIVRAFDSAGLDAAGQWGVVMEVERSRGDRNVEMAQYVLKIDMHGPTLISQQSFPMRKRPPNEPSQIWSKTLRRGNMSVDLYGFSPEVAWFDHKGGWRSSLLDDGALISTRLAILFDLADRGMPGIAILGTRIPNPILETLNEHGLFLYVWNGQKYILEKKRAFPPATQERSYDIEAFTLLRLSRGVGGKNNPAGVFISREGSYDRALYIFR